MNVGKTTLCIFAAALLAMLAFLIGVFVMARLIWPVGAITQIKAFATGQSGDISDGQPVYDAFGRLMSYPGKTAINCPRQTAKTMVLLAVGQSYLVNNAGQRYTSNFGDRIVQIWNGKCYQAFSPLLGISGTSGESLTLLGNKLVASGMADQVVFVAAAIKGTGISRWKAGGDMNDLLGSVIADVKKNYRVTHVLWHQGESDFDEGTNAQNFSSMFFSLVDTLRTRGIDAPILTSVASKCRVNPLWKPDNPVATAQRSLPDKSKNIFMGVDTDTLLTATDRFDDCHFSATGQEKFADAWVKAIKDSQ